MRLLKRRYRDVFGIPKAPVTLEIPLFGEVSYPL